MILADSWTLMLDCGFEIELDCLFQYGVYGGLIEGLPTPRLNADVVLRATRLADEKLWSKGNTHLIPPRETPIELPPARASAYEGLPEAHRPARIPGVASVATFTCMKTVRDDDADSSVLNVVWFQDHFGVPTHEDVLQALRAIDWRKLAEDVSF